MALRGLSNRGISNEGLSNSLLFQFLPVPRGHADWRLVPCVLTFVGKKNIIHEIPDLLTKMKRKPPEN